MGLNVAKGVLTAPAATGSQTISLASNFDPRAIILWATYETADTAGATGTNGDGMLAIGCATYDGGTVQQWFASTFDDDATASAAEQPGFNTTACLSQVTAVGSTVDFVCTLTSMSTGATSEVILNWTDVPASQILVHYLILGGSDLTAARAGSWTAATASATQNITVNTGWGQPDLLMFCTSGWDSLGYPTTNSPDEVRDRAPHSRVEERHLRGEHDPGQLPDGACRGDVQRRRNARHGDRAEREGVVAGRWLPDQLSGHRELHVPDRLPRVEGHVHRDDRLDDRADRSGAADHQPRARVGHAGRRDALVDDDPDQRRRGHDAQRPRRVRTRRDRRDQ
jgi:hypothetical protein